MANSTLSPNLPFLLTLTWGVICKVLQTLKPQAGEGKVVFITASWISTSVWALERNQAGD